MVEWEKSEGADRIFVGKTFPLYELGRERDRVDDVDVGLLIDLAHPQA